MAFADRIKVTTATTGTGALTLSATGVRDATNSDFLAPAENLGQLAGRTVTYFLLDGNNWAQGYGVISANGLSLARDPNEVNWNGSVYAAGLLTLSGTTTVIISPTDSDLSASNIGVSAAIMQRAVSL